MHWKKESPTTTCQTTARPAPGAHMVLRSLGIHQRPGSWDDNPPVIVIEFVGVQS